MFLLYNKQFSNIFGGNIGDNNHYSKIPHTVVQLQDLQCWRFCELLYEAAVAAGREGLC